MGHTMRELCKDWLISLGIWERIAGRGSGLTATTVITRLLAPTLVGLDCQSKLDVRLSASQQADLMAQLADLRELISEQLLMVREVVDRSVEFARHTNSRASAYSLGEKALGRVGQWNAAGEPVCADRLRSAMLVQLRGLVPASRILDRNAFGEFEEFFNQTWDEQGAANLANLPYSEGLLGPDLKPQLISYERENTWDGLGRSVYSRYRLAAADPEVTGDAVEIATAEIIRACGRWGLCSEAALVVLHSLLQGLFAGPQGDVPWRPPRNQRFDHHWREEAGPIRPSTEQDWLIGIELVNEWEPEQPDPADVRWGAGPLVHRELARQAQAGIAKFARTTEQGRYLWLTNRCHEAHEHVMRRAWMMCFQYDRRQAVLGADQASELVNRAIRYGIPAGQKHLVKQRERYRTQLHLEQAGTPSEGSTAKRIAVDPVGWLTRNPDLIAGLADETPEAIAKYEWLARKFGLPPWDALVELRNNR